jgi:hypothetical protein
MNIRPAVDVAANFAPADFHYSWSLALSGHLTHAHVAFTTLRLGVGVEAVVLERDARRVEQRKSNRSNVQP